MRGRTRGFTLIEILVALAILASIMVAAQQAFSGALTGLDRSEQYARAAALARAKLTELELEPGLGAGFNDTGIDERSGLSWEIVARGYEEEGMEPPRNVLPLVGRVRVSWTDAGREQDVVVETLLLTSDRSRTQRR